MSSEEMSEDALLPAPGLLSLPVEVLHGICKYLRPKDILVLSAVCSYLRSVFNTNSLWKKYTNGGLISQGLNSCISLVEPKFQNPCITSLEPLCEHRLHFLKQSRLLGNIRQGNFVANSTVFGGFISEFETSKPVYNRQVTYNSKFLFTLDYKGDDEVIKIFDIEISPQLLLTIELENHSVNYIVVTWVYVVGNKLVVRRDEWFDIYNINLPNSLVLLYSINVEGVGNQLINKTLIIGNLLFVEHFTASALHIWDVSNGNRCNDLSPKINGPDFTILGYSETEKLIVLSVGIFSAEPSDPHVFVYRIESQDFSPFKPVLNKKTIKCQECYGLINSEYVVLLNERSNLNYSVFVFNYSDSTLVVEKSHLLTRRIEDAKIVDGYLVLPSLVSVLVMSLKSLSTVWEFQLDSARSLVYEFPHITMLRMEVLNLISMGSVIVVHNVSEIEMWDFVTRKKLFVLAKEACLAFNDTFSKLITCDSQNMTVYSFW